MYKTDAIWQFCVNSVKERQGSFLQSRFSVIVLETFVYNSRTVLHTPCWMFFSRFEKKTLHAAGFYSTRCTFILWNYTTWHRFECKITYEIFRVIWTIFFAGLACLKGLKMVAYRLLMKTNFKEVYLPFEQISQQLFLRILR